MPVWLTVSILTLCVPLLHAMELQLTATPPGPQPVGTPVTWTAVASGDGSFDYQFSGRIASSRKLRVMQDFQLSNQFTWAVTAGEGIYAIRVTARNRLTGDRGISQAAFVVTSRVIGDSPAVTSTANPLVALYSAPGCPAGDSLFVRFSALGKTSNTLRARCTPGTSMNFYIAGMLPETTYNLTHVLVDGSGEHLGPAMQFTTGIIDPALAFPAHTILHPWDLQSCVSQGILLLDYLSPPGGPFYFPTAVDLQDRVVWYYPDLGTPAQNTTYFFRPVPNSNGHMLLIANDPDSSPDRGQLLREIDLAGNIVRQTNASRVSEQLTRHGKLGITSFDHDAIRLPNGHTLVIGAQERIFPAGVQNSEGAIDILGNAIVDLDENWQLAWSWSAYDHLGIQRQSVLGETCMSQPGCPPLTLATVANDWLHGNSIEYVSDSGDILFSIRNQDWVVKVNYADGRGDGRVLWRLGPEGDFAIDSADPYPWFSHQHDARLQNDSTILSLFDNGNTRVARNPGTSQNSRGYVLKVDEANRIVRPILSADLGVYSQAVGSAQKLDNGNYHFEAGFVKTPANEAYAIEILPDGRPNLTVEDATQTYRSYRMHSLYSIDAGTSVASAPAGIAPPHN